MMLALTCTDRYLTNVEERCRGDFEGRYMHMVRQSDELCKFFIAKFPEAKQIKFSDGKLYLVEAGRKPKEVPVAVCVYRVSIPMSVDILRERTLKCVCMYVCV